jgi:two-component system, response regulator YesN
MYNLLIVDDEPYVVNGLQIMFQDELAEDVDIYLAYSGSQAIEWMKKIRIDIVLSDINMPNITGLDLQDIIISQWPNCRIIFLSAYDNFNYVKQVIRKNAVNYILKTEGDEIILQTVRNTIHSLMEQKETEILLSQERVIREYLPSVSKELLVSTLNNDRKSSDKMQELFDYLKVPLIYQERTFLMLVKPDHNQNNKAMLESIRKIVTGHFESHLSIVSVICDDMIVFFIQSLKELKFQVNYYTFIVGEAASIQSAFRQIYTQSISIAVTSSSHLWNDLHNAYQKLLTVFQYHYEYETEMLIDDSAITNVLYNKASFADSMDPGIQRIQSLIDNNQLESYTAYVAKCVQKAARDNRKDDFLSQLLCFFRETIVKFNAEEVYKYLEIADLNSILEIEDMQEITENLIQIGKLIIGYKFKTVYESQKNVIILIHEYINEHLSEDISLATIAQQVHFNPFYLSRLYKQLTGKNLIDYITQVRLKRSIELLRNKNNKIRDIVCELGFAETAYFTRFFKKHTQMTPTEFRCSLGL